MQETATLSSYTPVIAIIIYQAGGLKDISVRCEIFSPSTRGLVKLNFSLMSLPHPLPTRYSPDFKPRSVTLLLTYLHHTLIFNSAPNLCSRRHPIFSSHDHSEISPINVEKKKISPLRDINYTYVDDEDKERLVVRGSDDKSEAQRRTTITISRSKEDAALCAGRMSPAIRPASSRSSFFMGSAFLSLYSAHLLFTIMGTTY
jgi:hypothetical protein